MGLKVANTSFLPDWNAKHFHVLDPSEQWAPAISRELASRWGDRPGIPSVSNWQNSKQLQSGMKIDSAVGLVMFFEGIEKHCLAILGRLMDSRTSVPIAAVLRNQHIDLSPVLLESGVTTIIMEPGNDVPIADWCFEVMERKD